MKSIVSVLLFSLFVFSVTGCKEQEIKESFYNRSKVDLVAFTGDPLGLFSPVPNGIKEFDPGLVGGIAVLTEIRDSAGKIVGFATEMEVAMPQENGLFGNAEWLLKISGRGALFLSEVEDLNYIVNIVEDMKRRGETIRSFDPPIEVITTVPGTGKIQGGTKEFEGVRGTFKEINRLHELNLEAGTFDVEVELEIIYLKKDSHP